MRLKKEHKCPYCGLPFRDATGLTVHLKDVHRRDIKGSGIQTRPPSLQEQLPEHETFERQHAKKTMLGEGIEVHTLEELNLNRHIFISGQTQTGKSVVGKFIFVNLKRSQMAIFFDYKLDPNHDNFIKHFEVFTSLGEIKKHFSNAKTFLGGSKDMRVVYRPPRIVNKDITKTHSMENPRWQQMNELAEFAYSKGNVILFIDEVSPFTTPQTIPPSLYDCYIMGASRGVVVVTTTQRPNTIHNTMISESYTRFLFRHELESDRMKLKGIVGPVAEQLRSLPERKFMLCYVNGETQPGELIIPKKFRWILKKP